MKHEYGMSYGTKRLAKPPSTIGGGIGGITVPKGGTVAAGARITQTDGKGEKGRAVDPNCDKVRAHPANP